MPTKICGEDNASFKTEEEHDDGRTEIEMNSVDSITSGGRRKRVHDSQMPAKNGSYSVKFLFVCITLFRLKHNIIYVLNSVRNVSAWLDT